MEAKLVAQPILQEPAEAEMNELRIIYFNDEGRGIHRNLGDVEDLEQAPAR